MNEKFDRLRKAEARESGVGPYSQVIVSRRHIFVSDEPEGLGGADSGPDPIELLSSSLAACTAMTLRMFAKQKKMDLGRISVTVEHQWVKDSEGKNTDRFERILHIEPMPEPDVMEKLLSIAERCPVHRAMSNAPVIETSFANEMA